MGKMSTSPEQLIVSFSYQSDPLDTSGNSDGNKTCVELGYIDLALLGAITYAPAESLHLINDFHTISGSIKEI
jgi:hypothetical protein